MDLNSEIKYSYFIISYLILSYLIRRLAIVKAYHVACDKAQLMDSFGKSQQWIFEGNFQPMDSFGKV